MGMIDLRKLLTPRNGFRVALLGFVAASVVAMIVKSLGPSTAGPGAADGPGAARVDRIVVFYFHRNKRCTSCRTIERLTRETLEKDFAAELASGRVEWRVVNVETPGNEHFLKDYDQTGQSAVVSDVQEGRETRWKDLIYVWDLLRKEPEFRSYVRDEVRDYLTGTGTVAATADTRVKSLTWIGACLLALWLGISTSVSPCPMATNLAAISYVGKRAESPAKVLLAGILYTLGRTLAYLVLAALLAASVLSRHAASEFVQGMMNRALGPILIVAGAFLLELVTVTLPGGGGGARMKATVERLGVWSAALLGVVFALAFCPVTAALFFGALVPLAVKSGSSVIVPSIYGVGTALPVVVFAVILAFGARAASGAFKGFSRFEWWARRATGVVFMLVGVYYSLVYVWGVTL